MSKDPFCRKCENNFFGLPPAIKAAPSSPSTVQFTVDHLKPNCSPTMPYKIIISLLPASSKSIGVLISSGQYHDSGRPIRCLAGSRVLRSHSIVFQQFLWNNCLAPWSPMWREIFWCTAKICGSENNGRYFVGIKGGNPLKISYFKCCNI